MPLKRLSRALALILLALSPPALAETVEEFYRGKTITILIGGSVGVSYDFVGRAMAAHMGKHIPGNPGFIVENMPGATGLIMTNTLYNRSKRDGTVIGMPVGEQAAPSCFIGCSRPCRRRTVASLKRAAAGSGAVPGRIAGSIMLAPERMAIS